MTTEDPRNLGWLEYEIAATWAHIKAGLYCLRCPFEYQVGVESVFVEDRGRRDRYGDPIFRERFTWIGVLGDHPSDPRRRRVVKTYFGKARLV